MKQHAVALLFTQRCYNMFTRISSYTRQTSADGLNHRSASYAASHAVTLMDNNLRTLHNKQ